MTLFTMWQFWVFVGVFFVSFVGWSYLLDPGPSTWSWTCVCGSTLSWSGDVDPDVLLEPFLKAHKGC